ncbi:hypothetical protein ABZ383_19280 [Streptomyces sp. NPDC005900]|uniref:hypothetical protein n=1 Tax=unclassified Streptomyces TaxID=2593676 RepID=UPI0033DF6BCC
MSNQKRTITVLTLAAAALAMAGQADASSSAVHDAPVKNNNVGKVVADTLADPSGTTQEVMKGTKTGLSTAKTGLDIAHRGMLAAGGK